MLKKILKAVGAVLVLAVVGIGIFVGTKVSAFNASISKKYDVPIPEVTISTDAQVLARGQHLAESLGGCIECHGEGLKGGPLQPAQGPFGASRAPNLTKGKNGMGAVYSDGELARLIKHGLRRDGTSVRFMPSKDFSWWPKDDVDALISWIRTQPPVDGEPGLMDVTPVAKVLDRMDLLPYDVARRIDHAHLPESPTPAVTKEYGEFLALLCRGCHGETLGGGPFPGAPSEVPVPLNITTHETGLKGWSFDDFKRSMREGKRKNGAQINPMMPLGVTKNFSDTELEALWTYLQVAKPMPFGSR